MHVTVFPLGPLQTNGYLLENGGLAAFVDPGGDPAPVLATLDGRGLSLEAVLLTHIHFDHVSGVSALAKATGAPVLASPDDAFLLHTEIGRGGFMGLPQAPDFSFDPLPEGPGEFLGLPCRVLSTPGHSPGSLSFHFPGEGVVFVGDLLFERSVGRTDFPGGDMDALMRSVRDKIFTLPGATVVYPGHGPATTVAGEMAHNPFFAGVL